MQLGLRFFTIKNPQKTKNLPQAISLLKKQDTVFIYFTSGESSIDDSLFFTPGSGMPHC